MERGTVVDFDVERGIGHVAVEGRAEPLFFHCVRITDGTRTIDPGTAVEVEIGPGLPGTWEATRVTKFEA